MPFIHDDFLLNGARARRLYHDYSAAQPILDFHCHLSPKTIAQNDNFRDLAEISLDGDHYKWRVMRANGVPERLCSGNAGPYERFLAWARTVPCTLRNPLYHWTHLELARYFGIHELLNEQTAAGIWAQANELLQSDELTPQGILKKFNVRTICTTEDPVASLEFHEQLGRSGFPFRVLPAFRPDNALRTHDPRAFNNWTDQLAACAGVKIARLPDFLEALRVRHRDFHEHGCRLSDHGLNYCFADSCNEHEAELLFATVRSGTQLTSAESAKLNSFLMHFFGRLDAEKNWTKQLHLGALRNVNARMFDSLGADTGFDCIGDWPQAAALATYLDRLDREDALPRVILFNSNPADNYLFATMAGCFQNGGSGPKIQFGSGWWFLDQKEGIEMQLNALSNCAMLPHFVGMITDSRSFLSFPRHEYFRRVLCNLLGQEMEKGLLPDDEQLIGEMVKRICFDNAAEYLSLPAHADPLPVAPTGAQR
jgi:glucuronate isomerase